MKTKLTFQIIKYIAILFFIYLILIYFKILPNTENNKNNNETNNKNNKNNIYKLEKLEAVCPLTIFNPNKQSINDLKPRENIPNPDISNSKTQVNNQTNKIHYCSVEKNTNNKSNQHCMLGNVYLDIEKCNNLE
jgi:hypothetical protein